MPTTGALLINPRRRRRRKTRTSKASRSRAAKRGWAKRRRRNTTKGQRRTTARRAYTKTNRRRRRKSVARRRTYTRRRNTTRGQRRTTARRAYMRTNRRSTRRGGVRRTARRAYAPKRRRNSLRRRSNPNFLKAIQQPLKRIPVVGPIAADAVGLGIPALFGAVSIEPVMWGLKYAGGYLPKQLQKVSFTIGGMVMGALVKRFLPASPELRRQFAVALATAGGAVDWYRMRQGQGTVQAMTAAEKAGWGELEVEALEGLGELELLDGFGDYDDYGDLDGLGELELLDGFGDADDDDDDLDGWGEYGEYGELELALDGMGNFTDPETAFDGFGMASAADAAVSGDDMTDEEAAAILAGPATFHGLGGPIHRRTVAARRVVAPTPIMTPTITTSTAPSTPAVSSVFRRFPGRRPPWRPRSTATATSQYAGCPYGRWFWLVKLYGYPRTMQVARLPPRQRAAYIAQLRRSAIGAHPGLYAAVTRAQMANQPRAF